MIEFFQYGKIDFPFILLWMNYELPTGRDLTISNLTAGNKHHQAKYKKTKVSVQKGKELQHNNWHNIKGILPAPLFIIYLTDRRPVLIRFILAGLIMVLVLI